MIRRRAHRGFTLVEILVVIGILLVLLAMGVMGYIHIDKPSAEKATLTRFEILNSILGEYEVSAGMDPAGATSTNPGDVNDGTGGRATAATALGGAISIMQGIPAVKQMIADLPQGALMAGPPPPVVVDGWKNPILFCSGSLSTVTVTQGVTPVNGQLVGATKVVTVYSVNGRPFWASAGQDGDFSKGDDNLYSTPVYYK